MLFQGFKRGIACSLLVPGMLHAAANNRGHLIVGVDNGAIGLAKRFDFPGIIESASFFPYGPNFTGGVRVAAGDVNNDGFADIITAAGPGAGPHVKVFSGLNNSEIHSFFPFTPSFTGGVYVASGDLNGDGFDDILVGAGDGAAPQVTAYDGVSLAPLHSFLAYPPTFTGGVRVAAGDVNGDGKADIVTGAGPGGGPHIRVFSGASGAELQSFFAFSPSFTGGVFVASGDVNGDSVADIVAGTDTATGAPGQVSLFSGVDLSSLGSFSPFGPNFSGGVRVAVGDLTGDGRDDLVVGTGPGAGQLQIFRGGDLQMIDSFFPFGSSYSGGIFVAAIPEPAGALIAAVGGLLVRRRSRSVRSA